MNNINPIILLALSKVDIDKAIRKTIEPSVYTGTATIKVAYDLKVGADFDQRVAAAANFQKLFAVALSKLNGVTVEALVREATAMDDDDPRLTEITTRAKAATAAVLDATLRTVSGKVTGTTEILEVVAA